MIQMNKIEIDLLSKDKSHDKKLIDIIYNYRQQIETLQSKNASLYENYKKLSTEVLIFLPRNLSSNNSISNSILNKNPLRNCKKTVHKNWPISSRVFKKKSDNAKKTISRMT